MSATTTDRRITAVDIAQRKNGERIVALTAYHAHTAGIVDRYCDFILVGDSLGMVMHGLETTVPVTLDMMILQGRAVMRGSSRALVVVDMPFGSYEESREQAFRNAARVLKETGAGAIKMEGGAHMADTVACLVRRGVPVMGHVGLTPQSLNALGGYRVQGKSADAAEQLIRDAGAVEAAGAFAVVLEAVPRELAAQITRELRIPTIGIGAGPDCDGQILVVNDLLGLTFTQTPKFTRQYANVGEIVSKAVHAYCDDVRSGEFPSDAESYHAGQPAKAKKSIYIDC